MDTLFENISSDQKSVWKPLTDAASVFFLLSSLGLRLQMFWKPLSLEIDYSTRIPNSRY